MTSFSLAGSVCRCVSPFSTAEALSPPFWCTSRAACSWPLYSLVVLFKHSLPLRLPARPHLSPAPRWTTSATQRGGSASKASRAGTRRGTRAGSAGDLMSMTDDDGGGQEGQGARPTSLLTLRACCHTLLQCLCTAASCCCWWQSLCTCSCHHTWLQSQPVHRCHLRTCLTAITLTQSPSMSARPQGVIRQAQCWTCMRASSSASSATRSGSRAGEGTLHAPAE